MGRLSAALIGMVKAAPGLGKLAKAWVDRYPDGSVTTIRTGALAGLRWKRYHRQRNAFWLGSYETENQEAFARLLKPGQCYWDLGANCGFFTLLGARLVGPQGRVLAFEPDPLNLAQLRDNVALNGFSQVSVLDEAAADRPGTAEFHFSEEGSAEGHLGGGAPGTRSFPVRLTTLDAVLEGHPKPDFIKMDIEGAELLALAGGSRVLNEVRPAWLVELHGPDCIRDGRAAFAKAGYRLFDISGAPITGPETPFQIVALP